MHNNLYPANKIAAERLLKDNKTVLILTPLKFYTHDDEDLFFAWIKKVKCIESIKGIGKELYAIIDSKTISDNDLDNLVGLFKRYKLKNPDQLTLLVKVIRR